MCKLHKVLLIRCCWFVAHETHIFFSFFMCIYYLISIKALNDRRSDLSWERFLLTHTIILLIFLYKHCADFFFSSWSKWEGKNDICCSFCSTLQKFINLWRLQRPWTCGRIWSSDGVLMFIWWKGSFTVCSDSKRDWSSVWSAQISRLTAPPQARASAASVHRCPVRCGSGPDHHTGP